MHKKLLAAGLACTLAFSLSAPCLGAYSPDSFAPKTFPSASLPAAPATGSLYYSQIATRLKANNPTVKYLRETYASMEAMNWDKAIKEVQDAVDEMRWGASSGVSRAKAMLDAANKALEDAAQDAMNIEAYMAALGAVNSASIAYSFAQMQAQSMQSTIASLEAQVDQLKDQKKEYPLTLEDTSRQIDSTIDQLISGAQSLYMTILATELQADSLDDTLASTARTVAEMEKRYELGQISKLTLSQVKQGYNSLKNNVDGLKDTISSMKASLQSLLGDTPTGRLDLREITYVTAGQLAAISYNKDLTAAKEHSFSLYSAQRTVDTAQKDLDTARKDHGKNSYQYKMAEHSYEAALYQQDAAIRSFELSFKNAYDAIAPARTALAAAQSTLAYQKDVFAAQELRYQRGLISANAYADAKDTLAAAQRDVDGAQLDLFTAYQTYRQAVELGLVSSGSGM